VLKKGGERPEASPARSDAAAKAPASFFSSLSAY